jgi:hypothetical protein
MDREQILDAIRRCAEENGGRPLGRERFYAATGIRESDWSGRFWIRWNDALVEAGFTPNRLNAAHEEEHLLRQLALFVRELGRYPVEAEVRMRRRTDPTFPSANTFRRFGNKQATIGRLAAYCETESELGDVLAILDPLVEAESEVDENPGAGPAASDGFVYLVKSGKHYKIGRSNSAGRRFYEIGLQLPEAVKVVHYLTTDDPVGIERYWHDRFADRRANGEWFALTAADVKAFRRRRFM